VFVVVEYCRGGSVWELMSRRGGRLGVSEATPIMLGALEGLAHAHAHGVIHRDLKPHNILLSVPEGGVAKLTDFGLAKDFELAGMSGMTRTGAIGGTPVFLPREQVVDFKYMKPDTDVCGMAAAFYTMLTGSFWRNFPPDRDPINVLLSEPVIPIRWRDPTLPKGLASVIDRAASDEPAQRYPTAREFRDALLEVL
jgi:serine/threonine-protein kinase